MVELLGSAFFLFKPKTMKISEKVKMKMEQGTPYVVISQLPDDQRDAFNRWISFQTCPVIDCETDFCAYYWDYEKWYDAWSEGRRAINLD